MDKWRIWFKRFDNDGKPYAGGVLIETYYHKSSAIRAAKKRFGSDTKVEWIIGKENPWGVRAKYDKDRVMTSLHKTLGGNDND